MHIKINKYFFLIIGLVIITWTCSNKRFIVLDDYFKYDYKEVYEYYIIEAWRGLDKQVPAYTLEMIENYTQLLSNLPYVKPTASGDKNMIIGWTPGWPKKSEWPDDPEILPQRIYGYQITNFQVKEPKIKIILTSGNHATEFTGNWVLEGMVNFIASDDPRAKFLRNKAIFYIYPDINPEGRYQAVNRIDLKAAPDPNARTDMRKRGNPELYSKGEKDHNRVWNTSGKFSTIDIIKSAMKRDTSGSADYLWDMHGPQEPANWRTPSDEARNNEYAKALMRHEPNVIRCGPESGFKINVAYGPPGKIGLYVLDNEDNFKVTYPYVYEPGGWSEERLMVSGRNLALAFYEILTSSHKK